MQKLQKFKQGKYVIGVSGGSDSMALLHMCMKASIDIVVAHMNYHKRESANRDENIVCTFCQLHQIDFESASPKGCVEGNFQSYARKERYLFYREVLKKYECDGILLAHHQDDVIETYIMQKQRGGIVDYYGIKEAVCLFQLKVYRPLLSYSKQALESYCKAHKIEYGIDESNLSDDYTRNYIRHHIVAKMDEQQRDQCLSQMQQDNQRLSQTKQQVIAFLSQWDQNKLDLIAHEDASLILQEWLYQKCRIRLSKPHIDSLLQQMKSKNQWFQALSEQYDLVCDYNHLHIQCKNDISYAYELQKGEMLDCAHFKMALSGPSTCAVTLKEDDYPIVIRNAQASDAIVLRFGTKKISRFFIDRHIPLSQRRIWPVLINCKGNVVLVPEIGCDIEHFSNTPTLFVLK